MGVNAALQFFFPHKAVIKFVIVSLHFLLNSWISRWQEAADNLMEEATLRIIIFSDTSVVQESLSSE